MWNGFAGDSGHRAIKYTAIPGIIFVCILYGLLDENDLNLMTCLYNITEVSIFPTTMEIGYAILWILISWCLYVIVPGCEQLGPVNNSGRRYTYKLNSFRCLAAVSVIQLSLGYYNIFSVETLSIHYSRITIVSIWIGLFATIGAYIKGRLWPTFDNAESRHRNNFMEDFYSGIELAPRWNSKSMYDLKLFAVGHIGMIIWHVMNVSHAAYGLNRGDPRALIVCILQLIYIIDWAWNERWYLYTIDMQHDRLGFYLAYGGFAWMVTMYTTYGFFTSRTTNHCTNTMLVVSIVIYLIGYALMRVSNNQKENFRHDFRQHIWGKLPKYLTVTYQTLDGTHRQNKLLLSGFWGWSRHFNYIGDLLLCISLSMLCGYTHIGAHIYTFQMFVLLYTRAHRDDTRCQLKYGAGWTQYRSLNPYLLIPGVY
jgi:7-dehydrocholesterol reductase